VNDPTVVVTRNDDYKASLASPLRSDVTAAFTKAVQTLHPGMPIFPEMSTGASDARPFRVAGIPVYGTNGAWVQVPTDFRAHGKDERIPVQSLYDNVVHWQRSGRQIGELMMRLFAALLAAAVPSAALAATDPRTVATQLPPVWQAKTREVFKQAIEIPSVHNRGQTQRVAKLLADQFRAAGIPESDIHVMPYEALPGDQTVALIIRWRSPHATKKPMLILGHMDVVEAKREDWKYDPFVFREEGGYFLGRGTSDMKNGDVATTMAAVKLMSEGFKPDRDIIFFYSGDEETRGVGATLGSTKWRNLTEAEFGLNADGGCASYDRNFRPLGCGISVAEKTFQTYFFITHNPGGHSSRPRPDNAIYDLADALEKLRTYRFQPRK
jgi:acetylornithine deacetylase/succinyl-diaminopimelate desuccinylase-like protein